MKVYTWKGMKEIKACEAKKRHLENQEVFLLFDDGSEAVAESHHAISIHEILDGEWAFGVQKEDDSK